MKVSCTQENLSKGLGIVGRSVGVRTTLPVLNNILIKTEKGGIKLSATDLELGISTWIGSKVDKEGSITIPAKLLLDYINTNNDKTIILQQKDLSLSLESEHYKANIKGIDASEFPLIPEVKKNKEIDINAKDFLSGITKTSISASLDESRPVLTGVYLWGKGNILKMVATDSYRLSEYTITLNKKIDFEFSFIVPQRTMNEVARILSEEQGSIKIYYTENQIEFIIGKTNLVSRLIEGSFPDYEQIIPKNSKTNMQVTVNEFTNAMKMASFFARESANNIKLRVEKNGKVLVVAVSPHLGDNISEISGKTTGDKLEIAFNAKFILDILSVINEKEISIEFTDGLSPAVLRGEKSKYFLYVIMPLRVDE